MPTAIVFSVSLPSGSRLANLCRLFRLPCWESCPIRRCAMRSSRIRRWPRGSLCCWQTSRQGSNERLLEIGQSSKCIETDHSPCVFFATPPALRYSNEEQQSLH